MNNFMRTFKFKRIRFRGKMRNAINEASTVDLKARLEVEAIVDGNFYFNSINAILIPAFPAISFMMNSQKG